MTLFYDNQHLSPSFQLFRSYFTGNKWHYCTLFSRNGIILGDLVSVELNVPDQIGFYF